MFETFGMDCHIVVYDSQISVDDSVATEGQDKKDE